MDRCVCIHGHCCHPPRENPWLEAIGLQDSAYPHQGWNKLITEACYTPNNTSGILDGSNRFREITNHQYLAQHELRKRIFKRFPKEGIGIPFPIQPVFLKNHEPVPQGAAEVRP
jgi:hypothetical protein